MNWETHDPKIQRCWETKAATIDTTSSEWPIPVDDGDFNNMEKKYNYRQILHTTTLPTYAPPHYSRHHLGTLSNTQKISPHLLPTYLSISAEALLVTPDRPSITISLSINLRSDRLSPPRSAIPSLPPYFPTFHPSPPVSRNALPSYSYPRPSFRTFSLTCDTHHISDNPAPSPRNPHHPHDHVSTHAQLRAITRRNQVANST